MNTGASGCLADFNLSLWGSGTNDLKSQNSTGVSLQTAKLYFYRAGTLQAAGTSTMTASPGTGTATQPVYTARCVSLLTNVPGRSRRGRIYLPYTGISPSAATGLWTSNAGLLGNVRSMINTLTTSALHLPGTSGCNLGVLSRTQGVITFVTSLRMDNKPDTQRGRERKITPSTFDTVSIP
jgi:hypothetical protein